MPLISSFAVAEKQQQKQKKARKKINNKGDPDNGARIYVAREIEATSRTCGTTRQLNNNKNNKMS